MKDQITIKGEARCQPIQAQAPNCFGKISVFSTDGDMCNACLSFTECRKATYKALEAQVVGHDLEDILARHKLARIKVANDAMKKSLLHGGSAD